MMRIRRRYLVFLLVGCFRAVRAENVWTGWKLQRIRKGMYMRIQVGLLGCLVGIVLLVFAYGHGWADVTKDEADSRIGVVSIRRVFQECKTNAKYRQEATAEQDKVIAELQKLSKEIEAEKAGLKTLKTGSSDYMEQVRVLLEKQAKLEAEQEFYKQHLALKDQRWTEQLYQEILEVTGEIARQKGLDMVFERNEPELPAPSTNELMLMIRTHKLLYSEGCVDITDEVTSRLDSQQ